jgi:hypothetical protein
MAEIASYIPFMKTLLLFIGTVLRSRIIQRKKLGALPAIYKLIRYWWSWTPPQPAAPSTQPALLAGIEGGSSIGCRIVKRPVSLPQA